MHICLTPSVEYIHKVSKLAWLMIGAESLHQSIPGSHSLILFLAAPPLGHRRGVERATGKVLFFCFLGP